MIAVVSAVVVVGVGSVLMFAFRVLVIVIVSAAAADDDAAAAVVVVGGGVAVASYKATKKDRKKQRNTQANAVSLHLETCAKAALQTNT